MSLLSVKAPRKKQSDDALIPLINIVFLLLIFFMVAGSIQPSIPVELNHPVAAQIDHPITAQPVQITLTLSNDIYWNETKMSVEQFGQAIAKDVPNSINLHVDQQVTAGYLDTVLNVIRQHQIATINHITQQTRHN